MAVPCQGHLRQVAKHFGQGCQVVPPTENGRPGAAFFRREAAGTCSFLACACCATRRAKAKKKKKTPSPTCPLRRALSGCKLGPCGALLPRALMRRRLGAPSNAVGRAGRQRASSFSCAAARHLCESRALLTSCLDARRARATRIARSHCIRPVPGFLSAAPARVPWHSLGRCLLATSRALPRASRRPPQDTRAVDGRHLFVCTRGAQPLAARHQHKMALRATKARHRRCRLQAAKRRQSWLAQRASTDEAAAQCQGTHPPLCKCPYESRNTFPPLIQGPFGAARPASPPPALPAGSASLLTASTSTSNPKCRPLHGLPPANHVVARRLHRPSISKASTALPSVGPTSPPALQPIDLFFPSTLLPPSPSICQHRHAPRLGTCPLALSSTHGSAQRAENMPWETPTWTILCVLTFGLWWYRSFQTGTPSRAGHLHVAVTGLAALFDFRARARDCITSTYNSVIHATPLEQLRMALTFCAVVW